MGGKRNVVYLIGAGASHACIKAVGSPHGILMSDLVGELAKGIKKLVEKNAEFGSLAGVVNEVVDESADIEHLITFFDESPASSHRRFAEKLRQTFEKVLKKKLVLIETDLGPARASLYSALLDMYTVDGFREELKGILTLNYDDYIESAVHEIYGQADHVDVEPGRKVGGPENGWRFLKLHGSFAWEDAWPIARREMSGRSRPLWIPPGIRKGKERYPFNLVWGLARDVLNCDVVRVIGCRLGSSDWDLVSLLFGTRHANSSRDRPYRIEIIDSPWRAEQLKESYPYLDVKSILEIDTLDVGRKLVADFLGGTERRFDSLSNEEREGLVKDLRERDENWFRTWLVKMAEGLNDELGGKATETSTGAFRKWLKV